MTKRLSPLQSIKKYCKCNCCNNDLESWKNCSVKNCLLYSYRLGHGNRKSKEKPQQNMRSQNSNRRPQGTRSSTLTNTIARRDERTPSKNWGRQSK